MNRNGLLSGSSSHVKKAIRRTGNRMNALTQTDRFQIDAAEGWLMLGNPIEAHEELEQISGDGSYHPAVLSMRWQVYAAARWWEAAFVVSKALCELAPQSAEAWICQANTLR